MNRGLNRNMLATAAEQDPETAHVIFDNIEYALNQVLPGSDTHERYRDAEEVGLAVVVGRASLDSYNPFNLSRSEPSFSTDNSDDHPAAWDAMSIPPEFLDQPTELGRFAFFALAKAENIRATGHISSFNPAALAIKPGQVGFAGARRFMETIVSVSGLWEVHDHLVSGTYATDLALASSGVSEPRSGDQLAEYFDGQFARIQALHEGIRAEEISHADIGHLLSPVLEFKAG